MSQQPPGETAWSTPEGTIRRGMPVIAPDGTVIGTVAGVEGEELLLEGASGEQQEFVALSQVDGVGEQGVLLSGRGDATFGLGAQP